MTYLQLINEVLARLRETTVSTNSETTYSSLIGKFVNDAKRQIEDAFNWDVLSQDLAVNTVANTYKYSLTGAGQKFQLQDSINITSNVGLKNISFPLMNRRQNFATPVSGIPSEFIFEGVDVNNDAKVTLYPRPDGVYALQFTLTIPQADLASDSTVLLVPSALVIQNAFARALAERGEDGGLSSSEAYQLYRAMLSDYIALEATRFPDSQEFVAV
jgi:hypothetical protein